MKIYRGPSSKPFWDVSHELVSRVGPSELEDGIRSNALFRFNITKDGGERFAVCTARFDDEDIVPMISGLLSRLERQQSWLKSVKESLIDASKDDGQKLESIRAALENM